tara:strand:- start:23 stop:226 length:204 start_codon:yes stop_codon:yes gene_type:complete
MDNSKDFMKVLEGLASAKNILNNMLTPEILEQMTDEQRQEIEDAKKGIDNDALKKASKDLKNFTNKY